ncbi:MAG: M24 family metallopeptidase [Vulcanimicrobiota bacterium]
MLSIRTQIDNSEKLQHVIRTQNMDGILISNPINRKYYSNFSGSNGWLFVLPQNKYIITDNRYFSQVKRECPDFQLVKPTLKEGKNLKATLKRLFSQLNFSGKLGIETGSLSVKQFEEFKKDFPTLTWVSIDEYPQKHRILKNEYEIAEVRKAVHIAQSAFMNIKEYLAPGSTEREISARLTYHMRMAGATKESFDIIVGAGTNGALPHARSSQKRLQEGEAVVIDWGALVESGYQSDMTRTIFIGHPHPRMQEIYNTVLEAQLKAIKALKPGIACGEVDRIAREHIENAGYGEYFGHGLGHGIGLETHEAPSLGRDQETLLEPGMVVTIEPGIYLEDLGGVRIEDMALITETGSEILTSLPK